MPDHSTTERNGFHLYLIKVIGVIVPQRLRLDWRQEWEAELRYRKALLADWEKLNCRTKLDLFRRSLGAFRDAITSLSSASCPRTSGSSSDVLKAVMKHGIKLIVVGITLGLGASFALTRFITDLLFGVEPTDPATLVSITLLLLAVALVACFIPARRATRVDPISALRVE